MYQRGMMYTVFCRVIARRSSIKVEKRGKHLFEGNMILQMKWGALNKRLQYRSMSRGLHERHVRVARLDLSCDYGESGA